MRDQQRYDYLIVGGGMAADAAIRGIRDVDPEGTIGLIGAEADPPYKRPPLSKKLWQGKPPESVWLKTERLGVDLHLGHPARLLDPRQKCVVDERGATYTFDTLLLATGVTPLRLPFGGYRVIYFRTLQDYHRLRDEASRGHRFAVIGGGFIGSEIAAALTGEGKEVVMIFPEAGIGSRLFPSDLSLSLNDVYREHGVEVLAETTVEGIAERGNELRLRVRDGASGTTRDLAVDGVVAGIGTRPNIELALSAGLAVDNGIVVDRFLRTSHPDIYAAGDVASFWQPALAGRRRVEHEDNARMMGRFAGQAMAGQPAPYTHLPAFYSDLFDLGYEAVGDVDSRCEMTAEWEEPYRKGIVSYRLGGRLRGQLLWNVWGEVDAARARIADPAPLRGAREPQESAAVA